MRIKFLLLTAALAALTATATEAQEGRRQVTIQAQMTIPDVLLLSEGNRTDAIDATGRAVTTATVQVKANRGWSLALTAADIAAIEQLRVNGVVVDPRRAVAQGNNTNAHQVVLEIKWKATPSKLQYDLSAS
jgi:hypothetical protein